MCKRLFPFLILALLLLAAGFVMPDTAMAQPGTLIRNVPLPVRGFGVSVAVDCNGNVYYTLAGNTNLFKMDKDGKLLATIPITNAAGGGGLLIDEFAWDNTRKVLWAQEHDTNPIKIYQLEPTTGVATFKFAAGSSIGTFRDGIAFDASDDTLWISGDVSNFIDHVKASDGTPATPAQITPKNATGGTLGLISGVIVGVGDLLYLGQNGRQKIVRVKKSNGDFIGDFASPGGARDEGLECDAVNFPGKLALWSREFNDTASTPAFMSVIEVEPGTCACGGGGGETSRSISKTFSPGVTSNLYDFDTDSLRVDFPEVLRTFSLTVTRRLITDAELSARLDPNVFPAGTACFHYDSSPTVCTPYDFTGNAGGPNGLPQKDVDYTAAITLTLIYLSRDVIRTPAFGHARGDSATFTEDILRNYSDFPMSPPPEGGGGDPTMDGQADGFSSVIALNEPLAMNGNFCGFEGDLAKRQTFKPGDEIDVEFRLTTRPNCTGRPIPDAIARISVVKIVNGQFELQQIRSSDKDEELGNRFRFDAKERVYEFSLNTKRFGQGDFALTVFSNKFSPRTVRFKLAKDQEKEDE